MKHTDLLTQIEYLSEYKSLLLLSVAGSSWQKQLLQALASQRTVWDFADPALRVRAKWQPEEFVHALDQPLLLNLQYVLDLLPHLCKYAQGCIAVTRQKQELEQVEAGVGLERLELPLAAVAGRQPFVPQADRLAAFGAAAGSTGSAFRQVFAGSLAVALGSQQERVRFYTDYISQMLQHAVKAIIPISDDMKFYRFMCAAAANTAAVVNYAQLAKAADISSPTAKQWLNLLAGAGVVTLLPPLAVHGMKRLAKAPKLYFADTGLACYLLRLPTAEVAMNSAFAERLLESWVVQQIRDSYLQNAMLPQLSYYRDANAKEISLVLQQGDCLHPVEIRREPLAAKKLEKKFALLQPFAAAGLYKIGIGCQVCFCHGAEPLTTGVWQLPLGALG